MASLSRTGLLKVWHNLKSTAKTWTEFMAIISSQLWAFWKEYLGQRNPLFMPCPQKGTRKVHICHGDVDNFQISWTNDPKWDETEIPPDIIAILAIKTANKQLDTTLENRDWRLQINKSRLVLSQSNCNCAIQTVPPELCFICQLIYSSHTAWTRPSWEHGTVDTMHTGHHWRCMNKAACTKSGKL